MLPKPTGNITTQLACFESSKPKEFETNDGETERAIFMNICMVPNMIIAY